VRAAALRISPADDDELFAVQALRFDPDPPVTWCVGSIGLLGDGAFEAQLAGLCPEGRTVTDNVLTVAQAADLLLEQPLQRSLRLISGSWAVLSPFRNKRSKAKNTS